MFFEAILAALLQDNAERCDPPLDDDESQSIARSVAGYEPGLVFEISPTWATRRGLRGCTPKMRSIRREPVGQSGTANDFDPTTPRKLSGPRAKRFEAFTKKRLGYR